MRRIDLTGQRFGRLVVKEYVGTDKARNALYKCECDCGNETIVNANKLKTGHTQSCGCLHRDINARHLTKHGCARSRLYRVWNNILNRIYNANKDNYQNYGGRGVKVCEEWLGEHGFENFQKWAISHGYDENAPHGECTIDRIDVNGDYCPKNCRLVPMRVQNNNKRNNRYFYVDGEKQTLAQLAKRYGFNYSTLHKRIEKGWGIERALRTPVR